MIHIKKKKKKTKMEKKKTHRVNELVVSRGERVDEIGRRD